MPFEERKSVLEAIAGVHEVLAFDDSDGSAKDVIKLVRNKGPWSKIVFANGGDRNASNIPEMDGQFEDVVFVFGVGGNNKKNSSSKILKDWANVPT